MSDIWFMGSFDEFASGGFLSPDPVIDGTAGWTWDVQFTTDSTQMTYARTSINSLTLFGDGYAFSGIVSYKTLNSDGSDTLHSVGSSNADGIVDFISDTSVVDVTFGWGVGGGDFLKANFNCEIWVTG